MNPSATRKLYNTIVMLGYLIGIVAPGTEWRKQVVDLIDSCPLADTPAMGFPPNWRGFPAWKNEVVPSG